MRREIHKREPHIKGVGPPLDVPSTGQSGVCGRLVHALCAGLATNQAAEYCQRVHRFHFNLSAFRRKPYRVRLAHRATEGKMRKSENELRGAMRD